MALEKTKTVDRSYIDNISVKEETEEKLVPKYFSEIEDPSLRTVGTIGFTTEQISNISEDAFNTGSVLFRETFPNRAQIDESIYSHAAIFKLSNIFASAAKANFLYLINEEAILENMLNDYDKDTGIYRFYIDKETRIYINDTNNVNKKIVFSLDYDVEIKVIKREDDAGHVKHIFSASYIMDEYNNSISVLSNPYIKVRHTADGYVALELEAHQCTRQYEYEQIITNSTINYPTIDIPYTGKLAGFDVLYKTSSEDSYNTQLQTLVTYSQPIKEPFCYYRMESENVLRLTFNTKDNYFVPAFNSEIQVILYLTDGDKGNFDVYNGTDIQVVPCNEKYAYSDTYAVAAKPITSSDGGKDEATLDSLQALTVEKYQTADALTTENDLNAYFSNYKNRFGNSDIKFIRRRDDVYERVYSAFIIMRNGDYIFHTNTLDLNLNLSDMKNPENSIYMIEPGMLFTENSDTHNAEFFVDTELHDQYWEEYQQAIKDGTIPYITENYDKKDVPAYLDRPASFAEFKRRKGYEDKKYVFDLTAEELKQYDNPRQGKFLIVNPFLIRFKKQPNLVSMYMTYVHQNSLLDFTKENDDSFIQFIIYQLGITRDFEAKKRYNLKIKLTQSTELDKDTPIIRQKEDENGDMQYIFDGPYNAHENDCRVIMAILDDTDGYICFTELYPTDFDPDTNNFTFENWIFTDDHITSDNRLRILDGLIYRNAQTGEYYKVHPKDDTLYDKYSADDELIESDIPVDTITNLINTGYIKKWYNVHNMKPNDDIVIPVTKVTCKIFTLYHRVYSNGKLVIASSDQTNNVFTQYDPSLSGYIWTNEYSTDTDPIDFMKPLNSCRSHLQYYDYTACTRNDEGELEFQHDIMDVYMGSIPFIRWSLAKDVNGDLSYFMNSFSMQYNTLESIIQDVLRNVTNLDVKFYNTYGFSKTFTIGENKEILDTVNVKLSFDMWFIQGTDLLSAVPEVKAFIKKTVETISTNEMNNLYISNLMRKIESQFGYVDHIRFKQINAYPTNYQAIKNYVDDINDLTVEERRFYVPEALVVDLEDIVINQYFVTY